MSNSEIDRNVECFIELISNGNHSLVPSPAIEFKLAVLGMIDALQYRTPIDYSTEHEFAAAYQSTRCLMESHLGTLSETIWPQVGSSEQLPFVCRPAFELNSTPFVCRPAVDINSVPFVCRPAFDEQAA